MQIKLHDFHESIMVTILHNLQLDIGVSKFSRKVPRLLEVAYFIRYIYSVTRIFMDLCLFLKIQVTKRLNVPIKATQVTRRSIFSNNQAHLKGSKN